MTLFRLPRVSERSLLREKRDSRGRETLYRVCGKIKRVLGQKMVLHPVLSTAKEDSPRVLHELL